MKKILCLFVLLLLSSSLLAQTKSFKFNLYGGFELPEEAKLHVGKANGFNVSFDMKYYVHDRIYALGTVYTAKMKGDQDCIINLSDGSTLDGEERKKSTNTFVGLGLGYDFIKVKRHTVFLQGAFGLTSENLESEKIHDSDPSTDTYMVYEFDRLVYADWGIIGKIGYSYQINKWLGVGVAYSVNYLNMSVSQGFQGGLQLSF